MTLLVLYLITALSVSFFCSLLEAVMLSVTPSYVGLLIKTNHRSGRILKGLKENIDRPLAAILTVNSLAQIMGSAGVGAQAQKIYGDEMLTIASVILTFLMLFITEILPKTIGVAYWKRLAVPAAYLIRIMIVVTYPLVLFFETVTRLISKNEGFRSKLSREEMMVVIEIAQTEGTLVEKETRIIRNLLRLNNIYVTDVMTPLSETFSFHKSQTVTEVMSKHGQELYSRIPIYDKNPEDVVGLVLRFNIFNADSDDLHDMTMESLMTPINKVCASVSLAKLLDDFITRREHLFLAVDENEKTVGVITLEDVLETLLGVEIEDEIDTVEEMREIALQKWRERLKGRPVQKRPDL